MKYCSKCRDIKDLVDFHRDKYNPDGYSSACKSCRRRSSREWINNIKTNNYERYMKLNGAEVQRRYRKKYPEKSILANARNVAKRLGYTPPIISEYELSVMLINTNQCQCCGRDLTCENRVLDHCHETGKVRGILCRQCNTGIGSLQDNLEGIKNALFYLSKFEGDF